jgi:hypothetical protein
MRSNVALVAGVVLGATLGLACLFVLSPKEGAGVSPNGAAPAATKRDANVAKAAPPPAAAPRAQSTGVARGVSSTRVTASTSSRPSGLPGVGATRVTSKAAAAARYPSAVVASAGAARGPAAPQSAASRAKAAKATPPANAIEARISGFRQGIDMNRPVTPAGGLRGPAVIAMGRRLGGVGE